MLPQAPALRQVSGQKISLQAAMGPREQLRQSELSRRAQYSVATITAMEDTALAGQEYRGMQS